MRIFTFDTRQRSRPGNRATPMWVALAALLYVSLYAAGPATVFAQPPDLTGVWTGEVITTGAVSDTVPITIAFGPARRCVLQTPDRLEGTYAAAGHTLVCTFVNPAEKFTLTRYVVKGDTLAGVASFDTDPPGLVSTMTVKRQPLAESRAADASSVPAGSVSGVLDPPFVITRTTPWHYKTLVARRLCELAVNAGLAFQAISFDGDTIRVVVRNQERKEKLEQLLRPVLGGGTKLAITLFAPSGSIFQGLSIPRDLAVSDITEDYVSGPELEGCPTCYVEIAPMGSLRQEFIKNGNIDFLQIWSMILKVASTIPGLELDGATDTQIEAGRRIFSKPTPAAAGPAGVVTIERVVIEMNDAYHGQPNGSGKMVRISTTHEVWRRRTSQRRWVRLQLIEGLDASSYFGVRTTASGHITLHKAVMTSLTGKP